MIVFLVGSVAVKQNRPYKFHSKYLHAETHSHKSILHSHST